MSGSEPIPHSSDDLKTCPECGRVFQGDGWTGIDAHWKAKHEDVMPYEEAWPLLKAGDYKRSTEQPPVGRVLA